MFIADYEEEYYEPTIADQIFTEAANKLKVSLKAEVNNMIDSLVKENESLKKKNVELQSKISNLNSERREFENNKQSIIKNAVTEYVREKFGGFIWGDTVWMVHEDTEYKNCEHCNGTHKINLTVAGINKDVDCPHCSYSGKVIASKKFRPVKRIISQSNLKIWNENKTFEREFYLKELKDCTDHIWNVDIGKNVFALEDECINACNEKQNNWDKEHQI